MKQAKNKLGAIDDDLSIFNDGLSDFEKKQYADMEDDNTEIQEFMAKSKNLNKQKLTKILNSLKQIYQKDIKLEN